MSNLVPVNEVERMATAIAKSGFFGMKTPEQAMALMLIAQAEGRHPATAAQEYHVIQGKPALKSDAMLARFQQAGGKVEWEEMTDARVAARFSHAQGGSITIDWDMKRAAAAQLGGKDMWKKFPRQMLRARVISEGIRTVYPGVAVGMYTPEEVQDFDSKPSNDSAMVDITPPIAAVDSPFKTATARNKLVRALLEQYGKAETLSELSEIAATNKETIDSMIASSHESDKLAIEELRKQYGLNITRIKAADILKTSQEVERENIVAAYGEGFASTPTVDDYIDGGSHEIQY